MTNQNNLTSKTLTMVISALLGAIAIIIPMYSPIRIVIEPFASYTLASHVPVFIAMFISPVAAVFVAIISAFGFFISGVYPIAVVFRALSHILFAFIGGYLLKRNPDMLLSRKTAIPFVLLISLIHAAAEVTVSTIFYFTGQSSSNFLVAVLGFVGVGTLIHSTVDFIIAAFIWVPLQKVNLIPSNAKIKFRAAKN